MMAITSPSYSIEHRYNSETSEWHQLYASAEVKTVREVRAVNDALGWQKYRYEMVVSPASDPMPEGMIDRMLSAVHTELAHQEG